MSVPKLQINLKGIRIDGNPLAAVRPDQRHSRSVKNVANRFRNRRACGAVVQCALFFVLAYLLVFFGFPFLMDYFTKDAPERQGLWIVICLVAGLQIIALAGQGISWAYWVVNERLTRVDAGDPQKVAAAFYGELNKDSPDYGQMYLLLAPESANCTPFDEFVREWRALNRPVKKGPTGVIFELPGTVGTPIRPPMLLVRSRIRPPDTLEQHVNIRKHAKSSTMIDVEYDWKCVGVHSPPSSTMLGRLTNTPRYEYNGVEATLTMENRLLVLEDKYYIVQPLPGKMADAVVRDA
jgi:hypothetical protein